MASLEDGPEIVPPSAIVIVPDDWGHWRRWFHLDCLIWGEIEALAEEELETPPFGDLVAIFIDGTGFHLNSFPSATKYSSRMFASGNS